MKCDAEETGADTVRAIKAALLALLSSYAWVPALDLQRSCQQNDHSKVKRLLRDYPELCAAVYGHPHGGGVAQPVVYGGGASPLMVACLHNALSVVEVLVTEHPAEHNAAVAAAAAADGTRELLDGRTLIEVWIIYIFKV